MIKTVLIGRDRKTGKDVLLAGTEVTMDKQVEAYRKFSNGGVSDQFSSVNLFQALDYKKPMKLISPEEAQRSTPAPAVAAPAMPAKTMPQAGPKPNSRR